ncbi:MAG TPA: ABC transporter permease [Gemmatimonadaceae bacterium]|jgi:putative ABC transport system permease protein|nr:ABC transporter permease [Gemmatimonadaceae bacterium]
MFTKDLGFAVRSLRKHPAFTLTAIVTIALGVGSTTAIFSVVNAVLLRPLPYVQPDRLALIKSDMKVRKVLDFPIAPGDWLDLRSKATSFESIAGIASFPGPLVADDAKPEQIVVAGVTPNFFSVLGARIAFGRNFVEADGAAPPPPPKGPDGKPLPFDPARLPPQITIISHGLWQRKFGGDSSVIGKTVQIFGLRSTIVGVSEPDLTMVFNTGIGGTADEPDAYQANRIDYTTASRINVLYRTVGRLKPGANLATANAQLASLTADLQSRFPIKKTSNTVWYAEPMSEGIVKSVRPAILALMGAVMFVLLIACANVANLLLVRASARERELAVRSALGGSRRVLIAQMLAESLVLAGCGAIVGLGLAKLGINLLLSIAPSNLPRIADVSIDPMVLTFTAAIAMVAAFVFGILPALRASRPNLAQTLRASGRSSGLQSGRYVRQAVVVAEVALSFVLLVGSGLMLRSFVALSHIDPGYDPTGIMTFSAPSNGLRTPEARQAFVATMKQHLASIPGVTAVTAATPLPLDGLDFSMRWGLPSAAEDASRFRQATVHIVLPGYFEAMHARVLAGRAFTDGDNTNNATGIIIDDLLASKAFPGMPLTEVIGKQLLCRIFTPEPQMYQVIGVAAHERHLSLADPGREGVFVVDGTPGFNAAGRWALRTTGDPTRLAPEIRRAVAAVDPLVPIGELKPMSDYVDRAMAPTRFSLVLIGVFAIVAATLASIGLYGVLSTAVRQRTAEIGVRMAFGATAQSIFRLMIGQGMVLSGIGIATGLVAAFALTGVMQRANMLVAITPTDPLTYAAIAVLFAAIAALACWVPSRRAASLDPNVALREE